MPPDTPTSPPNPAAPRPGALGRLLGRRSLPGKPLDPGDPAWLIEQLRAGRRPNYGLYLRPYSADRMIDPAAAEKPIPDMEHLMAEAFDPLPLARHGRPGEPVGADGTLPSDPEVYNQILEALATYSRVMLIVPSNRPDLARELQLLSAADSLWRAIFWMPDANTLATVDWPTIWPEATEPFASVQLTLPPFTPGGWLFRFDPDGRACTFRIIAHTYKDKLAKTIEELCAEMKSR